MTFPLKLSKKEEAALASLGITDCESLLGHYPFRYEYLEDVPFSKWQPGDKVIFCGTLLGKVSTARFGKRTRSSFVVEASNQHLQVAIFNRPWLARQITPGMLVTIIGRYEGHQKVTAANYNTMNYQAQLGYTAIYHLKSGITPKRFGLLMAEALNQMNADSLVPDNLIQKYQLLKRRQALRQIHFPQSEEEIQTATRTLKYEGFLLFALSLLRKHAQFSDDTKNPKVFDVKKLETLINTQPFTLTSGQKRSLEEILNDLQSPRSMFRLLQGDVGSGKTLVAAIAAYATCLSGQQSAFMVPTEILAYQQFDYFKELLEPYGVRMVLLVASLSAKEKKAIRQELANGLVDIVIGTHALIQEAVNFFDLGLVVTDEQHRFGVLQRTRLLEKGKSPDYLLMSATPIPRTLATIFFGDLAVSTIDTLPAKRKPVKTVLIEKNSLGPVLLQILKLMESGERLYVVCGAIEQSESDVRNVTDIHEALVNEINGRLKKNYTIALLHGKLEASEKERIISEFAAGTTQILVSTTVIEVGINIPAANLMAIYDADRFGLSQLHQLRGRIGRGEKQGYCWLLSGSDDPAALARLRFLTQTTDGFEIARYDLAQRGPGDVLGHRQSGLPNFVLGDLKKDYAILHTAQKDAETIWQNRQEPQYAGLLAEVEKRLGKDDEHSGPL
jgi:ATP-dependent DNA helicase RecG